jgi:hypothetical protein
MMIAKIEKELRSKRAPINVSANAVQIKTAAKTGTNISIVANSEKYFKMVKKGSGN